MLGQLGEKFHLIYWFLRLLKSKNCMEVIINVFFEVASILLMGIVCFIIYIYAKLFLIKIGLIEGNQVDDSENGKEKD